MTSSEGISEVLGETSSHSSTKNSITIDDDTFQTLTDTIRDSVTEMVDKKLDILIEQKLQNLVKSTELKKQAELLSINNDHKNERAIQEKERKLRSANIIVHGLQESTENKVTNDR